MKLDSPKGVATAAFLWLSFVLFGAGLIFNVATHFAATKLIMQAALQVLE